MPLLQDQSIDMLTSTQTLLHRRPHATILNCSVKTRLLQNIRNREIAQNEEMLVHTDHYVGILEVLEKSIGFGSSKLWIAVANGLNTEIHAILHIVGVIGGIPMRLVRAIEVNEEPLAGASTGCYGRTWRNLDGIRGDKMRGNHALSRTNTHT